MGGTKMKIPLYYNARVTYFGIKYIFPSIFINIFTHYVRFLVVLTRAKKFVSFSYAYFYLIDKF